MAGTSIAKLAVVIVGDDGQLSVTMKHATETTKQFHGHTTNLLQQIKGGQGVMHLMEGRIGGLGHAMHLLGGEGALLGAGLGGLAIAGVSAVGILARFTEE